MERTEISIQIFPEEPIREEFNIDILAFSPHPDDAEIGCGGVLVKASAEGFKTAIIDVTEGEASTGGDPETRRKESQEAARILGLKVRENLRLPDCGVEDTFENRRIFAGVICKWKPLIVLAPYYILPLGRGLGHNDHAKTGMLASHGFNFSHLRKLMEPMGYEPHQAKAIFYYFLPPTVSPTFIVDVTEYYTRWIDAILAHKSQFGDPDRHAGIREFFESMARQWGRHIRAKYAQAFYSASPLKVDSLLNLVKDVNPRI